MQWGKSQWFVEHCEVREGEDIGSGFWREKYFREWIGWTFKDEWLPGGIAARKNNEGIKHYYIIPEGQQGFDKHIAETFKPIERKLDFGILHQEVDEESFEKYLRFIHPTSATGSSGLPLFALAMVDDEVKRQLRKFVNQIITNMVFGEKVNKTCSRGNTRPIGLLEHVVDQSR